MGKIYIIVLNYNGWLDTVECLESIFKSDYINFQVIVVDNASSDNSLEHIIAWANGTKKVDFKPPSELKKFIYPLEKKPIEYVVLEEDELLNESRYAESRLIIIKSKRNKGYAHGNNIAINYALGRGDFEYIWVLNNDTVVKADTLSSLVAAFKKKSGKQKLGMLGTIQMYYQKPDNIQAVAGGFNKWTGVFWNIQNPNVSPENIGYIYGASIFMKKAFIKDLVMKDIGLFNEKFFMYYEEADLCERARQCGYCIDVQKDIKIYHKYSASVSKLDEDFRIYYLQRNKLLFYWQHYKILLFVPLFRIFVDFLYSIVKMSAFKTVYFRAIGDFIKYCYRENRQN